MHAAILVDAVLHLAQFSGCCVSCTVQSTISPVGRLARKIPSFTSFLSLSLLPGISGLDSQEAAVYVEMDIVPF